MEKMALVDIKPDIGWFIWINNRSGGGMIKERLDRFLMSVSVIENFSFMATSVVGQIKFDHDAIMLDMWGRKPKEKIKDPRLCFNFDKCWAINREAKNIISSGLEQWYSIFGDKLDRVRLVLGPWQRDKYSKMKR